MEDLNGREPNHPQGHGNQNEKNQCYGNVKRINPTYTDKKHPRSIIKIKAIHCSEDQSHPTQKPVALLEWLIKTYTDEGQIVLDNTMGSDSTGVACVKTNRNFVGIELNEDYFKIAEKRIKDALADKESKLF